MPRAPLQFVREVTFARTLESRAHAIADPAEKLRFLRGAVAKRQSSHERRSLACAAGVIAIMATGFAVQRTARSSTREQKIVMPPPATAGTDAPSRVWLVERNKETELYSNGLRIEITHETVTRPRRYAAMRREDGEFVTRTEPAGIVFHTTESQLAPFDPDHTRALRANGLSLLSYVRQNALYHFVIDQFGRVFRVVAEEDYSNHAGHSVWADAKLVYVDLNQSFIGISFEAQTEAVNAAPLAAQVASARLLTEMLRGKYGIGAENCVTHAQVSVNPDNMQLGYHSDWAASFPFREMGLRDGYAELNPAVAIFGFGYGEDLIKALGGTPWPGLVLSEEMLVREAAAAGKTTGGYRKLLHRRYREVITAARSHAAATERNPG